MKTLQEFIEYARHAKPPLAYGSIGNGSQHHLVMEMLKARAGIDLLHVPFKGGGPATMALLAGDISAAFGGNSVTGHVKAGKLRALAVAGKQRSQDFPGSAAAGGVLSRLEVTPWLALFAPAACRRRCSPSCATPRTARSPTRPSAGRASAASAGWSPTAHAGGIRRAAEQRIRALRRDRQGDRRQGRLARPVAADRHAAHPAVLLRVEVAARVQRAAVVPEKQVADAPAMLVDEFRALDRVEHERREALRSPLARRPSMWCVISRFT